MSHSQRRWPGPQSPPHPPRAYTGLARQVLTLRSAKISGDGVLEEVSRRILAEDHGIRVEFLPNFETLNAAAVEVDRGPAASGPLDEEDPSCS